MPHQARLLEQYRIHQHCVNRRLLNEAFPRQCFVKDKCGNLICRDGSLRTYAQPPYPHQRNSLKVWRSDKYASKAADRLGLPCGYTIYFLYGHQRVNKYGEVFDLTYDEMVTKLLTFDLTPCPDANTNSI